jgi:aryl-alcohol dehydrogenase-like predicted oxidoreductase
LESAYDAGIRHFDVAPMYGFGQAEACLGEFLARHPGEVTVTTKYGIPPVKNPGLIGIARSVARPIIKALPGLKNKLTRVAVRTVGASPKSKFTAQEAEQSLMKSLRELRLERIDVWLLHEATVDDLTGDDLLRFMEGAVASGKIGTFGIGSERPRVEAILKQKPQYCRTVQFEWSVMDARVPPIPSFRIHHRALTENFRELRADLTRDTHRAATWSQEIGADLRDAEVLASLMLKAALVENPNSIILFSSRNADHIRRNIETAANTMLTEPARKLYEKIHGQTAFQNESRERVAR